MPHPNISLSARLHTAGRPNYAAINRAASLVFNLNDEPPARGTRQRLFNSLESTGSASNEYNHICPRASV